MSSNSKTQSKSATSALIDEIYKDLTDKSFTASLEIFRPESEEDEKDEKDEKDEEEEEDDKNETQDQEEDDDEDEDEEDEDEEDQDDDTDDSDDSDEPDESDESDSDDIDDVDINLGYGEDNEEPSGFATPKLFQNPIIFYRGYATQDELDRYRLSSIEGL